MAAKYYVELSHLFNSSHPVHKEDCPLKPKSEKCRFLGIFNDGNDAVFEGLKCYNRVKGCLFCIPEKPEWHKDDLEVKMLEGRN